MTLSSTSTPVALGETIFTEIDQQTFAEASGDCNPMHVDAVAARRLLSGRQVVHGIHTLLHALNSWRTDGVAFGARVACNFAHPVNVGDKVVFSQLDQGLGKTTLTAAVDGLICTEIVIDEAQGSVAASGSVESPVRPVRRIDALDAPLDEAPGSQVGTPIRLDDRPAPWPQLFPHACALLGAQQVAAIARLSYFVGMVCPGLHSVFSSLSIASADSAAGPLEFEVRKYDPRFRLFVVAFQGPIAGELRAFLRPPPQLQPTSREVAARVQPTEFKGTRSLVIGGSRGLGETTAKILAAGGGEVTISYATGRADAQGVAAEINAQGIGRCAVLALDLRAEFLERPGLDAAALDGVYFFSTPRIYAKRSGLFDRAAFDEFVTFYLQRFYQLCQWLNRTERPQPVKVYLPSTVFINDRPKGMTEYAMAKAAAEILVEDINRSFDNVNVLTTRLPRLATDQTASILKVGVESNLDALLPVVRAMNEAGSAPHTAAA